MITINVEILSEDGNRHFIHRDIFLHYQAKQYVAHEGTIRDTFIDIANQYINEEYYGKS